VNIIIARITKTSAIFSVFVLFIGILNVIPSLSSFIIVEAQKADESEIKREKELGKGEKCTWY
jgi:hypothetical protein